MPQGAAAGRCAGGLEASGINNVGQVVGNYTAGGIIHGFLYSGGSYTTLNVPGATLTNAMGINNDGLIVGLAIVGGTSHGFLAVPVPEPPSLTLSGIGALRLIGLAWRGRRSPG